MDPIAVAQQILELLRGTESKTARAALEIAAITIQNRVSLQTLAGVPEALVTVGGDPLVPGE